MKCKQLIYHLISKSILAVLIVSPAFVFAETVQELNSWTYNKGWDKLSHLDYSFARSPIPKRGLYDNIRLEILCKDNQLQFSADANSLITSQGKAFEFEYKIDKNNPMAIQMRAYPDTKRRGFTDQKVQQIVEDFLSGQSVFIRIHTMIRTVLSAEIPLHDAGQPIQQVLADCGIVMPGDVKSKPSYSLSDFEREFKKLTPEQQRQALDKIKALMEGVR